jgi:hypothetical protein
MSTINLVQGDTGPQIKVTLTRSDTGNAQDVTGATIKLRFRKKRTTTVLATLTNTSTALEQADGICLFTFAAGDLDVDEGYYEGEVEVVFSSGTRETVYEILDFYVREDFG